MTFYADLHIHSRFSRATSRDGNFETLALWARRKGLALVGTGDFTHPRWLQEIREQLVPAEPGLFRLRSELEEAVARRLGTLGTGASGGPNTAAIRFMLQAEISTIYKKSGRTRKVHHLIFVPDLDKAESVIRRLARIGNLESDGRPILGLDSRHLLEIALESGEGAFLIPAHIWTPWFSVLGAQSGFDTVEECYDDLAGHVFALETGLSSDPPMNWRVSGLDRYRLVSNSDAHSPANLAREACVFETDRDYFAVRRALETGAGYGGTVEFFPEEGKYHLDGHRKCAVRLTPEETRRHHGLCPACGKAVTVGVMHRVAVLADRPEGARPPGAAPFRSYVPLAEILGEILEVGAGAARVRQAHQALLARLGPELYILGHAPPADLRRACSAEFAEAVERMRAGRVIREAGYDGEYGVIRLFAADELPRREAGTRFLFADWREPAVEAGAARLPGAPPAEDARAEEAYAAPLPREPEAGPAAREAPPPRARCGLLGMLEGLDSEQRAAAEITLGPLLIVAGPGTGKTRTLTHRIAFLVGDRGAQPEQCLAITFTRRAAAEMQQRLDALLPGEGARIPIMTFHGFGCRMLREHGSRLGVPREFRVATEFEALSLLEEALSVGEREGRQILRRISALKRSGARPDAGSELQSQMDTYDRELRARGTLDFDDLIALPVELLTRDPELAARYRRSYPWLSVDEFQDIDERQYALVRMLAGANAGVCVIGDPDQAIYGFRGTDVRFFQQFAEDYPAARVVALTRNYRSGRMIVSAADQLIARGGAERARQQVARGESGERVTVHEAATDRAEAEFVVHAIERLLGGSTFFSMDSGRVDVGAEAAFGFADFAVLYRTEAQSDVLCEALGRAGMPFQRRSDARLGDAPWMRALMQRMRELPGELPLAERLDAALAGLGGREGAEERGPEVQALRAVAGRCQHTADFMSQVAMGVDGDLWDPRADRVSLLTLHASKGLEFPVVFIVGCEDGVLPLRWGAGSAEEEGEERRLFYVGVTRARSRLFLTRARRRAWRGVVRAFAASPFLADIDEELLDRAQGPFRPRRPRPAQEQLPLLAFRSQANRRQG